MSAIDAADGSLHRYVSATDAGASAPLREIAQALNAHVVPEGPAATSNYSDASRTRL